MRIKRCERKKSQAEGSLHFTITLKELDKRPQELQQTQREFDRAKEELDLGYSLGECMCQHLVDLLLGYFELLKYFQRPGLSSEGATITELDTNEVTTMEGNTIAVLPHRYKITQGVLV